LPATVCSTTDQREAIYGADFVVITIMVGGFKHYESDGLIPLKYGVQPTVGDTVGPGAVMRMIRTGPSLVEIGRNVAELAPDAWIFNYSNPMAMATWMLLNQHDKTVGLCHSIQSEYVQLARFLNIPSDEVRYTAGGINHIDFYITLTHQGRDLYPQLLQRKEEILAKHPSLRVKFELLEAIGGWPAEGEMHQNEYYPWFNKNPAMAEEYAAEIMWGFHVDKKGNGERDQIADEQISGIRKIDYARHLWQRPQPRIDREPPNSGSRRSSMPCRRQRGAAVSARPNPYGASSSDGATLCAPRDGDRRRYGQGRHARPAGNSSRPSHWRGAYPASDPANDGRITG
jgi:alpha-galactosidase/6-phospho-beta-glucosidase family protein